MSEKRANFNIAFVTLASLVVMGYMNAYSMMSKTEATKLYGPKFGAKVFGAGIISSESGNIMKMGQFFVQALMGNIGNKPGQNAWAPLLVVLALFLGFVIGNIYGFQLKDVFSSKAAQHIFSWSSFVLPLILFPFYWWRLPEWLVVMILGFCAGNALSFFRQVYHLDLNNAMSTGNARLTGVWFYEAFLKKSDKDKKALFNFVVFILAVLVYVLGSALCTALANPAIKPLSANFMGHPFTAFDLGFIIVCVIPYFFLPVSGKSNSELEGLKKEEAKA